MLDADIIERVETRKIVRVYSFHAEERLPAESDAHVLARVLSDREKSLGDITEPWRKFFDPWEPGPDERDPITAALSIETAKLQKQWLEFQKFVPENEKVDLRTAEPTVEEVIQTVTKAGEAWKAKRDKSKRRKIMSYFHRLCGTLDAHSSMLEIIPRGNQYMSFFTGTLTSIVKASVNHEEIAEELARSLCAISQHVADCEVDLTLFSSEAMKHAVADLYAHIFLFLTDTLHWYLKNHRKRLLDSFNETFLDRLRTDMIQVIQDKAATIKNKAAQSLAAEQRVTRVTVEETRKDLRIGLEGIWREQAESRYETQQLNAQIQKAREEQREERRYLESLHSSLMTLLADNVQLQTFRDPSFIQRQGIARIPSPIVGALPYSDAAITTRDDVLLKSAHLEDFFHRDRVRLPSEYFASDMVDPETLRCLIDWTTSSDSKILYLAGPGNDGDELELPMSMLAAKFIDFATQSSVPLVSYFCELRRGQKLRNGNTLEVQGLLELVYSLIRQTIELLPPQFECHGDLSIERFQGLDGTVTSLLDSIQLIQDLQTTLPAQSFCVIDGLQWLDDRDTAEHLERLIQKLREGKTKVLFTTSGQSRLLLDSLDKSELFVSEWLKNQRGGGSMVDFDSITHG